jgi:signal transduction histidine kinase
MRIICFLSFLLLGTTLFAATGDTITITGRYFIDHKSEYSLAQANDSATFEFLPHRQLKIGYNDNTTIWCFFTINNNDSHSGKTAWLSFANNHLDTIILYDGNRVRMLGDRTTAVSPFVRSQVFPIKLKAGEQRFIAAKIKKQTSFLEFSYSLQSEKTLRHESDMKIARVSFFLGLIFLLIVFNTNLFFISGNRLYIYYIVYSLLSAVYLSASSYYAKYLLLNDFIYISEIRIYSSCFWLMSLSMFLSYYMRLKHLHPNKFRIIVALNLINLVFVAITLVLLYFGCDEYIRTFFTLGYINFLLLIIVVLWSAVSSLKTNKSAAIYVLIAFIPQIIWGIGIILKSFWYIPRLLPEDSLVFICLYEVLLFGYVLSKNYIDTFVKNKQLIRQVTEEKENSMQAITQAQIRERRNIANIIHDSFGSKIAYILQLLELKDTDLANENIKDLAKEIRDISHQILPKSLDDGALISSLKSQIHTLNGSMPNTSIDMFSFDFPLKIDEVWIHDIYLISLEIINNAIKHGQAGIINIELYKYPEEYVFQYTDDGKGFDSRTLEKGFGLDSIEKRVKYYKGTFEINGSPGEGTVVQISMPVKTK